MRSRPSLLGPWCLGAVLVLAVVAADGGTTLYRWVDADGVTHYSDRPEPGAQRVKIAPAQTYKGTPAPAAESRAPSSRAAPAASYARLEIINPADGAVLWNTGGRIEVGAALEPDLAEGHQLWFLIDGKPQPAGPGGAASLEVPRGEHTLSASVTDAAGQELIASAPISFVVRQTSAATPPQGPSVSPRPQPLKHP